MPELTKRQLEYRAYLQTDHWRQTRERALARAEYRCAVCDGTKGLDVHHRTYVRIGAEQPADLTVLCRGCHNIFHKHRQLAPRTKASERRVTRAKAKSAKKKKPKQEPGFAGAEIRFLQAIDNWERGTVPP